MKRILTLALTLLCVLATLPSCEKAPFITMTGPRTFTFTRDGGTQDFTFSCNRDWSVSSSESWIRVSPSSGKAEDGGITVNITCDPNTTYDARSATVTVKLAEISESLTITQDTGIGLVLSPTIFNLTNASQDIEVEVQKNVQYSINIDEAAAGWIKTGGTKALTTDKVVFHIAANESYDVREGKITFKQVDGSLTGTVLVKQAWKEGLIVEANTYEVTRDGGTLEVNVMANVEYEVETEATWVHYVETKALSQSTVILSIDENMGITTREAVVNVKQKNGGLLRTVTVSQLPFGYIDFEGYTYKTIAYGNRVWFAENLRAKYEQNDWMKIWKEEGGEVLYSLDWLTYSMIQNGVSICPEGWHLSTAEDWKALFAMSSSSASAPFIKKSLGGSDDYSFGGNYGFWHTSSLWVYLDFGHLCEDWIAISQEGVQISSHSTMTDHFPSSTYRQIRCVRGPIAPEIQTLPVVKQTTTTAQLRGEVMNDSNSMAAWSLAERLLNKNYSPLTRVWFKYGTSKDNLSSTVYSSDAKPEAIATGLESGKVYYYQIFAEYEGCDGPVNGEIMSFKTHNSTLEYQGKTYYTTIFNGLECMTQNLQATALNDGTPIPYLKENSEWSSTTGPAQCIRQNDDALLEPYGRLYNKYTVETGKLCPEGWRLPTDADLVLSMDKIMELYGVRGGVYCAADFNYWQNPLYCSNLSGFSALPSERRKSSGEFYQVDFGFGEGQKGMACYIWSMVGSGTPQIGALQIGSMMGYDDRIDTNSYVVDGPNTGLAVRCVRNVK